MLDIKLLRKDLGFVAEKLSTRKFSVKLEKLEKLEKQRKSINIELEALQNELNNISEEFIKSKNDKNASPSEKKEVYKNLKKKQKGIDSKKTSLHSVNYDLDKMYSELPNIPHESVPIGKSEKDNVVVRTWEEIPKFDFEPKDHVELGKTCNWMDFESATKISGARFVVLRGTLARVHRALGQFMLDLHIQKHGYQEVYVPYLVSVDCLYGTAQLPKMKEDLYLVPNPSLYPFYYLIPTAEVALTNLVRDNIFKESELPIKYTALTPCFRREAGSYGKETKGMIRQHQFEKVEMVQVVKPEESYKVLDEMVSHAEAVLQALKLPYRVVELCTSDLGFSAAKTYDLEVWLPSQGKYIEVSSCSNTEAFQARRMKAKWRNPETKRAEYLHTLNCSGLAVGRTLVAIMENYQDKDGNISTPEVLKRYLGSYY